MAFRQNGQDYPMQDFIFYPNFDFWARIFASKNARKPTKSSEDSDNSLVFKKMSPKWLGTQGQVTSAKNVQK